MRKNDGIQARGASWYLDCKIGGQRLVVRLGRHISRSAAAEIATLKRAQFIKGELGVRKKKDVTFEKAATAFLEWVKVNKKPGTLSDYAQSLKKLALSFRMKQLSEISPFAIEQHKARRVQQEARVRVNRELAVLKCLFNRCREWGMVEGQNPVTSVKLLKEPKTKTRFLEPDEESRLVRAASSPLAEMIVLCTNTGLRMQSEAYSLRWDHIDLKRGLLTVAGAYAKSSELRTVPLNDAATAALVTLRERHTGELVFTQGAGEGYKSMREAFNGARKRAGLLDVTPHTLRHTFASRLAMAGVDPKTMMEIGGWRSLGMVQRYSHLSPQHKAEAVKRLDRFHNTFHNMQISAC